MVELETEWQTKRPESWARTANTADIEEVLRKHAWDDELAERMKSRGKLRRGALSVHVVANDWERDLVARHAVAAGAAAAGEGAGAAMVDQRKRILDEHETVTDAREWYMYRSCRVRVCV